MRIQHVKISNILGIKELEFEAGQFNEVSGPNGRGKTSVLEAIKTAIAPSGHDATLLHKGAEKGEIVLLLDDGSGIRRRVSAEKSDSTVKGADGKVVAKPADALRRLADITSVNPVDFLKASKKDRARVLLESMPIEVDQLQLVEMAGTNLKLPHTTHALAMIDAYHKAVYDQRTGTNRLVKDKEATIRQLNEALPDLQPGQIEGDEDALRARAQEAQDAYQAEEVRISTKLGQLSAAHEAEVQALMDQIQAKRDVFAKTKEAAQAQRQRNNDKRIEIITPLNASIATIANNRDAATRRQVTIENIATMEQELGALTEAAAAQNTALQNIEKYKIDLLNALPIPGLEVKDGDIFLSGVQFDRLNTAKQVGIAVEVAKLRAGDLPLICLDGMECLDSKTYETLTSQLREGDIQLFVTRVKDDEFSISTECQEN